MPPMSSRCRRSPDDATVSSHILAAKNLSAEPKSAACSFEDGERITADAKKVEKAMSNINVSSKETSKLGSNAASVKDKGGIIIGSMHCKYQVNHVDDLLKGSLKFISKPRTALFQGREDDEPMAHQNTHAEKSCIVSNMAANDYKKSSDLQFGSFPLDEEYNKKNAALFTLRGLLTNIIYKGATFKQEENREPRKHVFVGSMQVAINLNNYAYENFREDHESLGKSERARQEVRGVSKSSLGLNSTRSRLPRPAGPVLSKNIAQATNGLRFRRSTYAWKAKKIILSMPPVSGHLDFGVDGNSRCKLADRICPGCCAARLGCWPMYHG